MIEEGSGIKRKYEAQEAGRPDRRKKEHRFLPPKASPRRREQDLPRSKSSLRFLEDDFGPTAFNRFEGKGDGWVPITGFAQKFPFSAKRLVHEKGKVLDFITPAPKRGFVLAFEGYDQPIGRFLLSGHHEILVIGVRRHSNPPSLSQGISMKALMPPHDLARGRYDFTGFVINEMREELGHLDLAEKANALAILFVGNRKVEFPGNFTDPRFFDLAEGENELRQVVAA